ncbi:hypothetical protein [Capillimicrobium parvum]|uniref:Uncharacterized protein n=1 Tax=Capillimicrobium parvum TaxID=2884022 RepID=A0A9E6XSS3_9ACTN|nr:hypothetical protein [Capillimicrobium parvum]UGS33947.1 hypothetical protein DSM104329_00314 [Capillimicrobium parvum]
MTRDDAEDLVQALVQTGRKQTDDLRADIEALVRLAKSFAWGDADRQAPWRG